jgi:hypothetical protein
MLTGMVIVEDSLIQFSHVVKEQDTDKDFNVTFGDTVSGKTETRQASGPQLGAILALALGVGDDAPDSPTVLELYTLVEPVVEGLDPDVRPIP